MKPVAIAIILLFILPMTVVAHNKGADNITRAERVLAHTINQYRFQHRLPPMMLHHKMSRVAAQRSRDMARFNYFAHVSPSGKDAHRLMRKSRIRHKGAAENIVMFIRCDKFKAQRIAGIFKRAWKNSMPHNRAMLKRGWTHQGVSILRTPYGNGCHRWIGTLIMARK